MLLSSGRQHETNLLFLNNPEYKFSDHGSRYRLSTPDSALRKIKTNL